MLNRKWTGSKGLKKRALYCANALTEDAGPVIF